MALTALFSETFLTASSGTHLERIDYSHSICLRYKLLTSRKGSKELSFGFDKNYTRPGLEMTDNMQPRYKGKLHVKTYIHVGFGYV